MTIILSFSNTSNLTARRFNSHRQSHQKQHDTSQRNPYIVRWSILFPDTVHSIYTLPVTFYRHDMSCLIQRWIGNTLTHPSNRHMPVQTSEHSIIFRLQRRKRIDFLWLCNVFSCIWFYSDGCKYREKTESRLKKSDKLIANRTFLSLLQTVFLILIIFHHKSFIKEYGFIKICIFTLCKKAFLKSKIKRLTKRHNKPNT